MNRVRFKEYGLTAEALRAELHYDPATGIFTRARKSKRANVGDVCGCVKPKGYLSISVCGKHYFAHRLAWLYVYGVWPEQQIDHINRDPADNRIANLRDVRQTVNMHNIPRVGAQRSRGRWRARIKIDGKQRNLGTFETIDEASAAYMAAKSRIESAAHAASTPRGTP